MARKGWFHRPSRLVCPPRPGISDMAGSVLAALLSAGIIERAGAMRTLRLTARFLAHAEGTAGRLRVICRIDDRSAAIETALATWVELHAQPDHAASIVMDLFGGSNSGWIGQPPQAGLAVAA
jgi:hypothetical protein